MNPDLRFPMASVFLLVLAGCAADTETPPDESTAAPTEENTSESAEELRRGYPTYGYVAVGEFTRIFDDGEDRCTGTLVGHRSVLTAAHCVDFKNKGIGQVRDAQFTVHLSESRSIAYNVDAWHVFGTHGGADDLALLHLSSRASASVPIAQLRRAEPRAGDLAKMLGYGIHDCPLWDATSGHDDGLKRIYSYHWGTPPHALCAGDSGGPTFVSGRLRRWRARCAKGGSSFPTARPNSSATSGSTTRIFSSSSTSGTDDLGSRTSHSSDARGRLPRSANRATVRHRMVTRDQQKMETRRRILEALVDSLVSVGYSKTSTVEVQERAGVSRGALLHHFPTRAELFEAAVAHLVEHNERALAVAAAEPSPTKMHPMRRMVRVLNQAMRNPSYAAELELWAAARTDSDLRAALLSAERKAQRVLRRSVDQLMGEPWTLLPTYAATIDMTMEMLRGLATRRSLNIERAKEEALVENWSTFAMEMLDRQV